MTATASDTRTLPALKSLGRLSEMRPTLKIDTREQQPLEFKHLESVRGTLQTGDYSFCGGETMFSVEKKTIAELPGICTTDRERFEREMNRLRGLHFARLLIVGTRKEVAQGQYRSNLAPKSILNSLGAWEVRYGVPVVFAPTREQAATLIERWAFYSAREICRSANELLRGGKQAATGGI
ncbi:MAG: hypothetical protein HN341_08390 [Verrucomicrobia bacterium]|jgi:DNA excision repair protein ERCC-4|nr:hypothetical protein [Verrucomicrobiota bacterium]